MMGCRKLYELIAPEGIGRDRFEALLLERGYRVCYPKAFIRTTQAQHQQYYHNLIEGLEITGINQVWQSDFTYILMFGAAYYLVTIMDVYSRRIIGYHFDKHMRAESNIAALSQAFELRAKMDLSGLIHHSDRGGQYIDGEYVSLLKSRSIRISMCVEAWENAYEERSHRSLKYEYIYAWNSNNEQELYSNVKRAIDNYNCGRPHKSLYHHKAPVDFEEIIKGMLPEKRPVLRLHSEEERLQAAAVY
jgi:putative transposase